MNNLPMTATRLGLLDTFGKPELSLIRRTVAKDCTDIEFDQFLMTAARLKLNPLKKQIYAIIYNKDKRDKRNMVLVTAIAGYRLIADRTGDYRPDHELPVFKMDEKLVDPKNNPAGLISATVRVWKFRHGEWFPIPHEVDWKAYAPLIEDGTWENTGETWPDGNPKKTFVGNGKFTLDPTKQQWIKDPRGMLAKCAEAGALRKGWPDDLSNVYVDSELDKSSTVDLSPSEYAEQEAVQNRLHAIAGKDSILFTFPPDDLKPVPIGQVYDRAMKYFMDQGHNSEAVSYWQEINKYPLQEYWARAKTDALALKAEIEKLLTVPKK